MYRNPVEAFDAIQKNNIDLIFLDIEMPEMSGLEYLEEYKTKYHIIVISGDRKYALDTFEYGVLDYLLKPIEYSRFIKSVNKSVERNCDFEKDIVRERFFVKINDSFSRIRLSDIVLVDCSGDKDIIVAKKKTYNLKSDIIDFDKIAASKYFIKINEDVLVNREKIIDVCDGELIFDDAYQVNTISVGDNMANEIQKSIRK
jgi:DNA-binding LytR/AlgR family response regulator